MFHWIYCKSLWQIFFLTFLLVATWAVLDVIFCYIRSPKDGGQESELANGSERLKKAHFIWKIMNVASFIGSMAAILYLTIFSRSESSSNKIYFELFHFFKNGRIFEELYRMLVMNAFAFVPFGLTLAAILPERSPAWTKVLFVTAAGFLLSVLVEMAQYYFRLGTVEADDVLFNTVGAFVGSLHILLAEIAVRTGLDKKVKAFIEAGQ